MVVSIILILLSIVLGVAGELLLKSGITQVGPLELDTIQRIVHTSTTVITTPAIVVGFVCYGVAAVFWLLVLARFDLSYAYPMLALMYVLVPLAARVFLNESIPRGRWVGIILVIVGVVIVARFGPSD